MSGVSSYHSTATQARDTSYFKRSNLFRDLMKAQNHKANKLEALIKMGALDDNEYRDLGLKGSELHRYMQDRRQVYHDAALTKAHGPTHVRPGGPARFEKEVRYAASTASIEPIQPI
jgi:DNA polymerase III alpha subunit